MDISSDLPKLVSVFAWAFFSFWSSIPGGVALGLGIVPVVITAILSYISGVLIVIVLGDRLRGWLIKRFGDKLTGNPNSPIRRAWDRFGVIGLSLLAPILTGSQIGAAIAISLGANPRRVLLWMTVGAIVWGVVIGFAIQFGLTAAGR